MSTRLSHSALTKYARCGKEYEYWYIHKLRPKTQSAALLFGSAIDDALTALLRDKADPFPVFHDKWVKGEVNGVMQSLSHCTDIVYANSDFDEELLTDADIVALLAECAENTVNPLEVVFAVYEQKDVIGFDCLTDNQKRLLNLANWLCLYRKGILLIEAFQREILPNITDVLAVQEKFTFPNADGDEIIGFVDAVVRWKDAPNPIIFDWKTSTRQYDLDDVKYSPQLAMYVSTVGAKYNTRAAGYGVLLKSIKKNRVKKCKSCGHVGKGRHATCDNIVFKPNRERCGGEWDEKLTPEGVAQIIIDEMPKQTQSIVLDNADYINHAIKSGIFHRNFSACKQPWGLCDYYNLCWKGKTDGLQEKK